MKQHLITTLTLALSFAAGAFAQNTNPPATQPPAENPLAAPAVIVPADPQAPPAQTTPPPAETKPKAPKKSAAKAKKPAGYPFRGTLKSVDKAAMTFTVGGKEKDRVFTVTSQTRFTKAGGPATFADLAEGEAVSGYAKKAKDGKADAASVTIGAPAKGEKAKSTATKPSAKKAKAKDSTETPMPAQPQ